MTRTRVDEYDAVADQIVTAMTKDDDAGEPEESSNADLGTLTLSVGTMTPEFDPEVTDYMDQVAFEVRQVWVTIETAHSDAKIRINDQTGGRSGRRYRAGNLPVGETVITILVTSSDGTKRTTTLRLIRDATPTAVEPNVEAFTVPDLGGTSLSINGGPGEIEVGYAHITPDAGQSAPDGLAIYSFRQNGVLIHEAAVPAAALTRSGLIYAEVLGPVNTGIAMANPNLQDATVSFHFTDSGGIDYGSGVMVIPGNGQIAKFLSEEPFNAGSVSGTFTFESSLPVSVIAIRGFTNQRSEFLVSTLPVVDLDSSPSSGVTIYPHFVDGRGWITELVLVNPTNWWITGTVEFYGQGDSVTPGVPVAISVNGVVHTSFTYTLPPNGSRKLQTSGTGSSVQIGSIRVTPAKADGLSPIVAPTGHAVFSYRNIDTTIATAEVLAVDTSTAFRLYVQAGVNLGALGSGWVQSGVAIANPSAVPIAVDLELTDLAGTSTGLSETLIIPADGQRSVFLTEIEGFASLPEYFKGVLRASTSSASGMSVLRMRVNYNERGEFLMASTPASDENALPQTDLFSPHIVNSGGFSTQVILYSGTNGLTSSGHMRFLTQSGLPFELNIDRTEGEPGVADPAQQLFRPPAADPQ